MTNHSKPATAATAEANERATIVYDMADRADFHDADRGFIAPIPDRRTVNDDGKVVYDGDVKLEDDGPAMQAMAGLLRVSERRSRLLGLDAPAKSQVEVVNYDAGSVEARVSELRAALEQFGRQPIPLDG